MIKVILALVFCFVVYINGYTQTKQESIKELFQAMQTESTVDEMFNTMIPGMLGQMQAQNKDSISKEQSEEIKNSLLQTAKEMSLKMINEDMVVLYDKYSTQDEISDLIESYKTPSGQKYIKVTPDISKDLMTVMMQKYIPEIRKSITVKTEELKSKE